MSGLAHLFIVLFHEPLELTCTLVSPFRCLKYITVFSHFQYVILYKLNKNHLYKTQFSAVQVNFLLTCTIVFCYNKYVGRLKNCLFFAE